MAATGGNKKGALALADGISCTGAQIYKSRLYWAPHDAKVWALAMVLKVELRSDAARPPTEVDLGKGIVFLRSAGDGVEVSFPLSEVPLHPANPSCVDDMTALFYMHEPGILANLDERAQLVNQRPYTYISNVLIAVNPLRFIPGPKARDYVGQPVSSRPPHPFGLAETAYRQLALPSLAGQNKNQSIIISGESGAGKTETAKIVLRYLCSRSTDKAGSGESHDDELAVSGALERRLMESNPVLEAFGNAKTIRNHNSSRFGKFMKICFEPENGAATTGGLTKYRLAGALIDTYLLEKSRVTSPGPNERSYHIFYQLIAGAPANLRQKLRLKDAQRFRYLSEETDCFESEGIDDAADYEALRNALRQINIDNRIQDLVFRTVAGVLHLGQITFHDRDTPAGISATVDEPHTVTTTAEMLGVMPAELERLLTTKQIETVAEGGRAVTLGRGGVATESISKALDAQTASFKRDGFAKSLYNALFNWIVKRVGFALSGGRDNSGLAFIGILDIFGFECFETNSFEQLLINFANESLQRTFNRAVLDAEQTLYIDEGLGVEKIEYADNSECVDLMWSNTREFKGILHLLEETCEVTKKMNQNTSDDDERFCSLLHSRLRGKWHFPRPHPRNIRATFIVQHFAGAVQYNVANFVQKNVDIIPVELPDLARSSTMEADFLVHLLGSEDDVAAAASRRHTKSQPGLGQMIEGALGSVSPTSTGNPASSAADAKASTMGGPRRSSLLRADKKGFSRAGGREARSRPQTMEQKRQSGRNRNRKAKEKGLAIKFGNQIAELSAVLDSCNCSFVRCVKPNGGMTMGVFDPHYVVEQLRSLGIIQTCGVLKQGLPTRVTYAELDGRYRHRLSPVTRSFFEAQGPRTLTEALLWAFRVPSGVYYLGKTRIFFKYGQIEFLDELLALDMASERGQEMIARLHKWLARRRWRRACCIIKCQHRFIKYHALSKTRIEAAVMIQSAWRSFAASSKYRLARRTRRRWRVAFLKVQIQRFFVKEYELIRESRRMREDAETESRRAAAEAKQREEAVRMEAQRKGSLGRIEMLEERNKIAAAVAASSLATVSVCLLRWQKAPLFWAMEKWMEIIKEERTGVISAFLNRKAPGDDELLDYGFDGVGFRAQEMSNTLFADADVGYAEAVFEAFCQRPEVRDFFNTAEITVYLHGEGKDLVHKKNSSLMNRENIIEEGDNEDASVVSADDAAQILSAGSVKSVFKRASSEGRRVSTKVSWDSMAEDISDDLLGAPSFSSGRTPLRRSRIIGARRRDNRVQSMFIPASPRSGRASVGAPSIFSAHGNVLLAGPGGDIRTRTTRESMMSNFTLGAPPRSKRSLSSGTGTGLLSPGGSAMMLVEEVDPQAPSAVRFSEMVGGGPSSPRHGRVSTMGSSGLDHMRRKSMTFGDLRRRSFKARSMRFGERLGEPCSLKGCPRPATHGVSIRFCELHYIEFRKQFKENQEAAKEDTEQTDTLQKQIDLLKRQLEAAGQQPAEFVDLETARKNMTEAVARLMEGDEAAEKEIERWDAAIRMNPEYQEEQAREKAQWLADQKPKWEDALRVMRGLVSPDIFEMSLPSLKALTLPSGDPLPPAFAKRLWSKKILWLVRAHQDNIRKFHIADLRGKYSFQGLDIVEMRAVALAIPNEFDNDGDGAKADWRGMLIQKLRELCSKEERNGLSNPEKRNNCYKTMADVVLFDPDIELKLNVVTKSTAFDATEQPVISSTAGSVSSLRTNLFSGSGEQSSRRGSPTPTDDLSVNPGTSIDGYLNLQKGKRNWQLLYFCLNNGELSAFETKAQADGARSKPKIRMSITVEAVPVHERPSTASSSDMASILEGVENGSPRSESMSRRKSHSDGSEEFYLDEEVNVDGRSLCFAVCAAGQRLVLSADSDEDKARWLESLKDAFRWAKMGNSGTGVGNPMFAAPTPKQRLAQGAAAEAGIGAMVAAAAAAKAADEEGAGDKGSKKGLFGRLMAPSFRKSKRNMETKEEPGGEAAGVADDGPGARTVAERRPSTKGGSSAMAKNMMAAIQAKAASKTGGEGAGDLLAQIQTRAAKRRPNPLGGGAGVGGGGGANPLLAAIQAKAAARAAAPADGGGQGGAKVDMMAAIKARRGS